MKKMYFFLLFWLVSCSHHHNGGHEHIDTNSKLDHKTKEFSVYHAGKEYYFETEAEKQAFLKSIEIENKRNRPAVHAKHRH